MLRADRDRRVGRAIGGRAYLADRPARELRQQRETVERRGLALVGRHAERRVALGMLCGAEPFAMGEREVFGGDIVLEVDETLAAGCRRAPQRRPRVGFRTDDGRHDAPRPEPEALQGLLRRADTARQGGCGS